MSNSSENFPDAFDLRISISWPEIYNRERGGYWERFLETESELRFELEEFISESSNNHFRLNELFYRRGSIELFIVIGATYNLLKELKDYKDLRESIDKLCEDVSSLVKRFCQRVMPDAQKGANLFYVKTAWGPLMATTSSKPEDNFDDKLFKAYEEGKHRRYNLLFAVNGGAFAVAKLLGEKGMSTVGNLTMSRLAIGMILFTTVMSFDIFTFGWKMRAKSIPAPQKVWNGIFALPGWIVLSAIWLLISVGWLLVV